MSFLDLLEDTSVEAGESVGAESPPTALAGPPASVEVLSKRSEDDLAQERLRDIEDSLYEQATTVVSNALAFTQIEDTASKKVPGEGIAELGYEKAAEKHRTALYALASSKEAPIQKTA